jgi:hypothetical protein
MGLQEACLQSEPRTTSYPLAAKSYALLAVHKYSRYLRVLSLNVKASRYS